jgi:glycosyltransferase involved in cell wall biosynthesis
LAERLLRRLAEVEDSVLCFGNLPPLFILRAKVVLFIQNRYLVEQDSLLLLPIKLRLKLTVERFLLKCFGRNVNQVLVQTPSMKALASKYVSAPITVAGFAANNDVSLDLESIDRQNIEYDFIYVASGEAHKNHKNLVLAWIELAKQGVYPSLCLTVSPKSFPAVAELIRREVQCYNLKIDNLGLVVGDDIFSLYEKSTALIYPSILESFGLPLIEAKNAGLKVVSSELDYVRDILDPEESFDPQSPISIARAVKRFLKLDADEFVLMSAEGFLDLVVSD